MVSWRMVRICEIHKDLLNLENCVNVVVMFLFRCGIYRNGPRQNVANHILAFIFGLV